MFRSQETQQTSWRTSLSLSGLKSCLAALQFVWLSPFWSTVTEAAQTPGCVFLLRIHSSLSYFKSAPVLEDEPGLNGKYNKGRGRGGPGS